MNAVSVFMSDPEVRTVETADLVSFCSGIASSHWSGGEAWLASPDEVGRVCAACGDAAVLQVVLADGAAVELRAWRGVISTYELY